MRTLEGKMYFPYLRGRQFELLAIKELANKGKLSDKVIPIIEPVKFSSTLINAVSSFENTNNKIAIISNPSVGDCYYESKLDEKQEKIDLFQSVVQIPNVIRAYIVNSLTTSKTIDELTKDGKEFMALCLDEDNVEVYQEVFSNFTPNYSVIPYDPAFREIRANRIQIADRFKKKKRNSEYETEKDEPFSKDHIFFKEDGYIGFSDYSIVGDEYTDSGFAPYAVAIHIVFFKDDALRIKHFVSDSNDDISDPANKFHEALSKLIKWNQEMKLDTLGMREFTKYYETGAYPGLGVVKKLSIMHHLEIMGDYLKNKYEDM